MIKSFHHPNTASKDYEDELFQLQILCEKKKPLSSFQRNIVISLNIKFLKKDFLDALN